MKSINPIRIVLADDHEIFRDGFKAMLKKQPAVELVGEAANGQELVELCRHLKPDVVVTDIKMPVMDGLDAAKILSAEMPDMGIIALSMMDEENLIIDMLDAGAKGYLLKNAHKDEIMEAIKSVKRKELYYCNETSTKLARMIGKSKVTHESRAAVFTEKEIEVIKCICQEMTNKEIAPRLHLSIRTIEGYRDKIQEKIGAKNAAGIVIYAIRHNIYMVD